MNNTFSLQQISRSSNHDANLISRQYKRNLSVDFMRVKYENPKLKQSEMANQKGLSSATIPRYRNDINMLSPYRIQPNKMNKRTKKGSKTNFDNNQHLKHDLKRPQLTSIDLKISQSISESSSEVKHNKSKNKLKNGSNVEINDHFLDEILHNNNFYLKLEMQIISNDKTVKNNTIQDSKELN